MKKSLLVALVFTFSIGINAQNVGIGTTNPLSKLDVNGTINSGKASTTNGALQLSNSSNANTVTITTGATTSSYTITLPTAVGGSGQTLATTNTSGTLGWVNAATGTVTSVGLALPSIFTVSGSPVTSSGTLTGTLASQSANTIFAAPSGSAGTPTFRALVAADLPISAGTGIGISSGVISNTGVTSITSASPLTANTAATGAVTVNLTGVVPIANGGTNGTATPTAGGVAYGTGSAYAFTAAGTAGQVLQSNGASAPTWVSVPSLSSGCSPTVNAVTKFTATTGTICNSAISENGTNVNISLSSINSGIAPRPIITDKSGNLLTIAPPYFSTGFQKFTASGTFTVPSGVYQVYVVVVGGGGGGGYYSSTDYGRGGAGGEVLGVLDVNPGEGLTVVVGAGGTLNGSAYAYDGTAGSGSSISRSGTLLAAGGGGGAGSDYGNGYGGYGGGMAFGTSINGSNPTGSNYSNVSLAGGNNYIAYLRNAITWAGYTYGTANTPNGGHTMGITGEAPTSTFETALGAPANAYGLGGANSNGNAGVVAFWW